MGKSLISSLMPLVLILAVIYGMNFSIGKKLFDGPPATSIVSHRMVEEKDGYRVIGEIRNDGEDSESSFSVEANLYDKDGKLLDTDSDLMIGKFAKGETRSFKVSFGCHKGKLPNNYDHFAVRVR